MDLIFLDILNNFNEVQHLKRKYKFKQKKNIYFSLNFKNYFSRTVYYLVKVRLKKLKTIA